MAYAIGFSMLSQSVTLASEIPTNDPYTDGKLNVIECLDKGGHDFLLFLNASTFSDGMTGIYEPWKDIFDRNQCHSNQVYSLIKQQDKIRKAIRDSFLTCETQKLPKLKKAHNRMNAEIYYVRNIVDGGVVVSLPYDLVSRRVGDIVIADRQQLYSEMYERYVGEDGFEPQEFDNFFGGLESKYAESKNTYIDCSKNSWEGVSEKWNEFMEFFGEDMAGLKDAGKNIAAEAGKLAKEAQTIKTVELFTNELSLREYAGAFVKVNLNGLDPKEGLQEIGDYLGKYGESVTQGDLLSAKSKADRQHDVEKIKVDLKGEFTLLYANSSDESTELFLNNLDGRSSDGGDSGLLEIIEGSFGPLNEIKQGSKTMLDRQCPG